MGGENSGGRSARLRRWLAAVGACAALLAPGIAEAKWLRAETPHFVIYSDGDEQVLRDYARRLEDFDDVLRYYHRMPAGAPPARKLDIYLLRNGDEVRRAFPHLKQDVVGFYSADEDDVFAVAYRSRDKEDRDDTLFHEYVHHFMMQYFPYPYPAWLVEGWAEYFSPTRISASKIDVGDAGARAYSLGGVAWVPMKDLLGRSAGSMPVGDRSAFYAQAWLLTHYMLADPQRQQQLTAYMKAVATGQDPVQAMEVATGADLATLDKELYAYTRKPLVYISHRRNDVPRTVTVTALPAAADALLLINQRAKHGVWDKDRDAFVAGARAAAAPHAGDAFADLVLARVEVTYGHRAAGEAILSRRLATDPNDVEALRLMALSKLKAGRAAPEQRAELYAQARPLLAKAFKADPDHYQTLYAYALSRSTDRDYPSENTLNTLLLAHQIAPQVPSIAFETARALAARGHKDEAVPMLTLLANAPHGGELAEAAKAELERLAGKTEQAKAKSAAGAGGG